MRWWRGRAAYKSIFPVISIGNITVGGSGKSVATRYFLTLLGEEKCAVVMRGYGGRASRQKKPTSVATRGTLLCDVVEAGDEAYALASATKALVVVGGDKRASVAWCEQQQKQDISFIILDDGYQSWAVARDFDVVLVHGHALFGNGYALPLGPLREKDLSRASCVLVTNSGNFSTEQKEAAKSSIHGFLPSDRSVPVIWSAHRSTGVFLRNNVSVGAKVYKEKDAVVVAGIGVPAGLLSTINDLGITVSEKFLFPDHHHYTKKEVTALVRLAAGRPLVTTEKDWVKIAPLAQQEGVLESVEWWVVRISLWCEPSEKAFFVQKLNSVRRLCATGKGGRKKEKTC